MSGECLVSIYHEFNDRGAIPDRLDKAIPILRRMVASFQARHGGD